MRARIWAAFLELQGQAFMHADRLLPLTVPPVGRADRPGGWVFLELERCGPAKHVWGRRLFRRWKRTTTSPQHNTAISERPESTQRDREPKGESAPKQPCVGPSCTFLVLARMEATPLGG